MNKAFCLKHKDISVGIFQIIGKEICNFMIFPEHAEHLPLPLKRIIHNPEEFIESKIDNYLLVNDDGNVLLDIWLTNREVPLNRDNYELYVKNKSLSLDYLLSNNGYTFTDCYWTCEEGTGTTWSDILLLRESTDTFYNVKDKDGMYKGQSGTLGGQLEKFWYKSNTNLKLCKKTAPANDILSIRELMASLIYEKQGFDDFCKYEPVFGTNKLLVGVKCFCFTSPAAELITAYDLLEEYNLIQQDTPYELIIKLAAAYGANEHDVQNYLDLQIMVDYLITNRDRHLGNIGFLRDPDTLKIIKPAPIYDSGSSANMEGVKPENIDTTTINGLYHTERECLAHVCTPSLISADRLPNEEDMYKLINLSNYISDYRKSELIRLYREKVSYIKSIIE